MMYVDLGISIVVARINLYESDAVGMTIPFTPSVYLWCLDVKPENRRAWAGEKLVGAVVQQN